LTGDTPMRESGATLRQCRALFVSADTSLARKIKVKVRLTLPASSVFNGIKNNLFMKCSESVSRTILAMTRFFYFLFFYHNDSQ